jgi:hypothetical protein
MKLSRCSWVKHVGGDNKLEQPMFTVDMVYLAEKSQNGWRLIDDLGTMQLYTSADIRRNFRIVASCTPDRLDAHRTDSSKEDGWFTLR